MQIALTTTTAGPFEAAVTRVHDGLSAQGFGVLTETADEVGNRLRSALADL